jgi:hypothetical protein
MIPALWLFGGDEPVASNEPVQPPVPVDPFLDLFGSAVVTSSKPSSHAKTFYKSCDDLAVLLTRIAVKPSLKDYALRLRSLVWEAEEAEHEGSLKEFRAKCGEEVRQLASSICAFEGQALLKLVTGTWHDATVMAAVV